MRTVFVIGFILLSGCATTGNDNWNRFEAAALDVWLANEAVPKLGETLTTHPRFRGEPVKVAIMQDDELAMRVDALSAQLRDGLQSALLEFPGLSIGVQDGPVDCSMRPAGYYLTVQMSEAAGAMTRVQLRLYDNVEKQWVSGMHWRWQGTLNDRQRAAAARPALSEATRGQRVLPFTVDQSDLLAVHLARELACELQRRGDDESIIQPARHGSAALIAGNLASRHNLVVSGHGSLLLDTRVHLVDTGLYQVWALLTPTGDTPELRSIASSAYAAAPLLADPVGQNRNTRRQTNAPARAPETSTAAQYVTRRPSALLSAARILGPVRSRHCTDARDWSKATVAASAGTLISDHECFAIEFEADPRAGLFIIAQETDRDLVRLYPARCSPGGLKLLHNGAFRFPANGAMTWDAEPGTETVVVIAARGSDAIARVDGLLSELPEACRQSAVPKRAPDALLTRLQQLVQQLGPTASWQSVEITHSPVALPSAGRVGT